MKSLEYLLAEKLLEISAIKLQPTMPFVLASGWNSPIYIDNRKPLSYPSLRNFIRIEMSRLIMENFGEVDAIAGVATGAIAHGALVADALGLPYVYVRNTPKDHGLENLIEGDIKPGQKVVIVEDLITTGQSSLKAAQAVSDAGGEVVGVVAIFNCELPGTQQAFKKAGLPLMCLTNFTAMSQTALNNEYITRDDLEILAAWQQNPANWIPDNNNYF